MKQSRLFPAILLILITMFTVYGQSGIIKDELPPPPPSKSRLFVTTNVPNAEVLINKRLFKTDQKGQTRNIDLTTNSVNIVVRHPDYQEVSKTVALKRGDVTVEKIELIAKFNRVELSGIPANARILIDEEDKTDSGQRNEKKEIIFARVSVGQHKLKIVHPEYVEWNGELEVLPNAATLLTLNLEPAPAKVTMRTLAGATVYMNDEPKGEVLPEGKLLISVPPGEYDIRVVKNGYVEKRLKEKLAIGDRTIEVKLDPVPNSTQFDEYFNTGLSQWSVPSEWKLDNSKLIIQGSSQLGLPKNRNYRDFTAQFSLKLLNGKGAAWAVRIQGDSYYLFYLSGPKGKFSGQFCT
ncbi:MAG: hypothetical protein AB1489_38990, partial [Acidobacteriota bacterium]